MSVTINVLRRTSQDSYYGAGIQPLTPVKENVWIDAETGKEIPDKEEPKDLDIKDIEMELIGSNSISDLTEIKNRKNKGEKKCP